MAKGRQGVAEFLEGARSDYSARNGPAGGTEQAVTPLDRAVTTAKREQVGALGINTRTHFDPAALEELAESIRQHGILSPLLVRPAPEDAPVRWELIAGERRLRAAEIAGLLEVPIIVASASDVEAQILNLAENLVREDIDPIEEAEGFRRLGDLGLSQSQIAARVGRKQPQVNKQLQLLGLPEAVQELVRSRVLSTAHGVAIARFSDFPAVAAAIAELVVKNGTASRDLEKGVPFAYELARTGAVQEMHAAAFDTSVCQKCPYGAYRNDGRHGACLKPEHFRELNDAAIADVRTKSAASLVAMKERAAADPKLAARIEKLESRPASPNGEGGASMAAPNLSEGIRIQDLPYDAYRDLRYDGGICGPRCPCFARVVGRDGKLIPVCFNPGRKNAQAGKATREGTKERKKTFEGLVAEALASIAAGEGGIPDRIFGLMVHRALTGIPVDVLRAVAKSASEGGAHPDVVAELATHRYHDHESAAVYALGDRGRLLAIVGEALVRQEIAQKIEYKSDDTPRTLYLLGKGKTARPAPDPSACADPEDLVASGADGRAELVGVAS